ncbi:MAG: hypothetical protein P0116_16025, partial [Candidatus Nitrosocosmicus sp.]|nr:hypothetical protein [Candidatus Nitrosocosmicus sp.]
NKESITPALLFKATEFLQKMNQSEFCCVGKDTRDIYLETIQYTSGQKSIIRVNSNDGNIEKVLRNMFVPSNKFMFHRFGEFTI